MSAIIKACLVGNSLKNTGKECDTSMVATAMLIAVPPTLEITDADLEDPLAWILPLMHADKQHRVYPFFGLKAPINVVTNNAESDILVTLDDGTQVFLRYGIYNRIFETIAGGLCYAQSLQGLNKSGYNIIEIDQQGQVLLCKNPNGTKRGLNSSFMYAPSPIMADFKNTPYKNRFQYSFSPVELVQNGEIFTGGGSLLQLMGLIDSQIIDAGGSSVTSAGASSTSAMTIAKGATGDTIDIKVSGVSITGGPVTQTSSETTDALLAAKVNAAINAATGTNGGFTDTVAGAIVTVTAPVGPLTVTPIGTVVGTISFSPVAFAGGSDPVGHLNIGVITECAEADLLSQFPALGTNIANFVITEPSGNVITPSSMSIVGGKGKIIGPFSSGIAYNIVGAAPSVWYRNDISGYDASSDGVNITI